MHIISHIDTSELNPTEMVSSTARESKKSLLQEGKSPEPALQKSYKLPIPFCSILFYSWYHFFLVPCLVLTALSSLGQTEIYSQSKVCILISVFYESSSKNRCLCLNSFSLLTWFKGKKGKAPFCKRKRAGDRREVSRSERCKSVNTYSHIS